MLEQEKIVAEINSVKIVENQSTKMINDTLKSNKLLKNYRVFKCIFKDEFSSYVLYDKTDKPIFEGKNLEDIGEKIDMLETYLKFSK